MGKILVVDDDPAFLTAIEKILVEAGYSVVMAPDGDSAIRVLEQLRGSVNVAIIDLALPGINGFELIGALTRRRNSVKVIATTSIFNNTQLETALALGAHAAIRKPQFIQSLPREQWLNTIEQLIGKQ